MQIVYKKINLTNCSKNIFVVTRCLIVLYQHSKYIKQKTILRNILKFTSDHRKYFSFKGLWHVPTQSHMTKCHDTLCIQFPFFVSLFSCLFLAIIMKSCLCCDILSFCRNPIVFVFKGNRVTRFNCMNIIYWIQAYCAPIQQWQAMVISACSSPLQFFVFFSQ